jgi:outer membrane receptor protein involved in Fe transport
MIDYPRINAFESFIYVENEIDPLDFLSLNLGLRWSGYNTELKFYQSFEPRLSAKVEVGNLFAISASYSKMQQYIHVLTNSG